MTLFHDWRSTYLLKVISNFLQIDLAHFMILQVSDEIWINTTQNLVSFVNFWKFSRKVAQRAHLNCTF